ncbi:MAG: hypothetical protein H6577_19590 [Lewinellaceae bacterium]|nr:hypothetical protein [Saprospiraceae bacterium]MCB9340331.1 hypothetical protein [Lewinellaceae bacterium]
MGQLRTQEGNNVVSRHVKLHDVFLQQAENLSGLSDQKAIPFASRLNFAPLLRFWQDKLENGDAGERLLAAEIMKKAAESPALWEPIDDDLELLQDHVEMFELLLAGIFPPCMRETQLGRATKPFDATAFYITPLLEKLLVDKKVHCTIHQRKATVFDIVSIRACIAILNQCYGLELNVDPEVVFTIEQEKEGITYYFKSDINAHFVEVKPLKPLKPLSKKDINKLLDNIYDLDMWLKALPPDHFEIHGITAIQLVDVTTEESLSRLRSHLLKKDALTTPEHIAYLEGLMRSYFRIPGLRTGIMALDNDADHSENLTLNIFHSLLPGKNPVLAGKKKSVYFKAWQFDETVLSESFRKKKKISSAEKALVKKGIKSHMVSPLHDQEGKIIGLLEFGASQEYTLNSFSALQLKDILPQYSRAVQRRREESASRIERVLRQKFTAIHPTVEWRFVDSAKRYLERYDQKGKAAIEPILFKDVYPLYAQCDIVSSSLTRNRSIQKDFITNLYLQKELFKIAHSKLDMPLIGRYIQKSEEHIQYLANDMQSSDEPFFMDYFHNEIHPYLKELAAKDTVVNLAVQGYFAKLDPVLGVVYDQRRQYEESVNQINNALSDFIESEDERAQGMAQHYFEKFQTDGVQFELYAGQALLRNGTFSDFQLNNLRLWQFITICEMTRRMNTLKAELPMQLETAQLIFVYGQPISIRFRMDEKFFDVDGAYNIRYEIIKKRIDKAIIADSEERLTQPGKIAIVYSSEKDREMYLDFCQYLIAEGYIKDQIEELELEKQQETQGLKALRVAVA